MAATRNNDECSYIVVEANSPSSSLLPQNDGFNRKQTLFLIDFIRQLVTTDDGPPKNLQELNARLKTAKSNKKELWKEAAETLEDRFKQWFCPARVARKWGTLVDGYKKVKRSSRATGRRSIRFQYYNEMDELIKEPDEVVIPVVGTAEGLLVWKPEVLDQSVDAALAGTAFSPTTRPGEEPTPPTPAAPLKRRRVDEEMMELLQQSEEATQRRHQEMLAQLRSAQEDFRTLMTQLLQKL
ncbi:uncharacterized protein LOC106531019 [Austrofundulus limnaeus]|uniref:Uncharacterized protein LOC106531019 n=1 Tax=Austrofundulus limnaeus TaxID=52670 RepID=A0A2I4CQG6_AUSLI|nr:PREDICTED: uncharacterized protein LOC106531019 [Austrofundulus limnaeus]